MGFSRQEYRSGLPFPSSGNLPNSGIEPKSAVLQADALLSVLLTLAFCLLYFYCLETSLSAAHTCIHNLFHYHCHHHRVHAQSCPTLCDPMDCSLLSSSVHWIFQVRILERVAISFFRGFSPPRDKTRVTCVSYIEGRFFTRWAIGKLTVTITIVGNDNSMLLNPNVGIFDSLFHTPLMSS